MQINVDSWMVGALPFHIHPSPEVLIRLMHHGTQPLESRSSLPCFITCWQHAHFRDIRFQGAWEQLDNSRNKSPSSNCHSPMISDFVCGLWYLSILKSFSTLFCQRLVVDQPMWPEGPCAERQVTVCYHVAFVSLAAADMAILRAISQVKQPEGYAGLEL